jgi:hypothetical protein
MNKEHRIMNIKENFVNLKSLFLVRYYSVINKKLLLIIGRKARPK